MTLHSLPPRGIFIPTQMLFHSQLPPAVLLTWMQLRALAWDGGVTPALSIKEIASMTGKSQSVLSRHIAQLSSSAALVCCPTIQGRMTISFPAGPLLNPETRPTAPKNPDSNYSRYPEFAAYFPDQILGYTSLDDPDESLKIEFT